MNARIVGVIPAIVSSLTLLGCSGIVAGDAHVESKHQPLACPTPDDIVPLKELVVVDPSVMTSTLASNLGVEGGALSFHRAMTRLAGPGADVAGFTEAWLSNWLTEQSVGNFVVAARPNGGINALLHDAGFWPRVNGALDMTRAPFRLLAVANRMDLSAGGKPNGEARLVYGLVTPSGGGVPMTMIFEYNLPTTFSLEGWAERFHALGGLAFGSAYNDALADLVADFATGENLSQLRTSEVFLSNEWTLREFHLESGALVTAPTANAPHPSVNNSQALIDWVNANTSAILSNTHVVPAQFLGGHNVMPFPNGPTFNFFGTQWLMSDSGQALVSADVRHAFASQTCNGCHQSDIPGGAGNVDAFYQVSPSRSVSTGDGTDRLSTFIKNVEIPQRRAFLAGVLPCSE